jgi:hypothetical protein
VNLPQNYHLNKVLHDLNQQKKTDAEAAKTAPPPPQKSARIRLQEAIVELLEQHSKIEVLDLCLAVLR